MTEKSHFLPIFLPIVSCTQESISEKYSPYKLLGLNTKTMVFLILSILLGTNCKTNCDKLIVVAEIMMFDFSSKEKVIELFCEHTPMDW